MSRRYRQLWPNQERAKWAIRNAIRRGKIVKPNICEKCGKRHALRNIEAHHWSYRKEHWTDVIWMCRWCHDKLHDELGPNWKDSPVRPVFSKPEHIAPFVPSPEMAAMPDIY